jgi:hypothetical protein
LLSVLIGVAAWVAVCLSALADAVTIVGIVVLTIEFWIYVAERRPHAPARQAVIDLAAGQSWEMGCGPSMSIASKAGACSYGQIMRYQESKWHAISDGIGRPDSNGSRNVIRTAPQEP